MVDRGLIGDAADEIQTAWARELPGTPVSSIGVITRIWRLAQWLEGDRRRTMKSLGMDTSTRNLLSTLRRSGEPYALAAGEVARRAGVSAGAVSQWAATCEQSGLVRRARGHDGDGRTVVIALTRRGKTTIDRAVGDLLDHEESLISGLTVTEVDQLSRLLRKLLADLEARSV